MKSKAIALLKEGNIGDAMRVLRILEEEKSTAGFACYFLGVCHYVLKEKVSAHSYFCRAVEHNYPKAEGWKLRCEEEI